MELETMKETRRQFSKLGLMYFLGTLIIIGVQSLSGFIATKINPAILENNDSSLLVAMLPMYFIGIPLMAVLIHLVPATPLQKKKMTVSQWLIAFLMCYMLMYVSNIIGNLITFLIGSVKGSPVSNDIVNIVGSVSPWVTVIVTVLFAPIAEEYLFRKLLIDRTVKYGEGVAVLFSGLIFGLFHGNLNQFAYAFTIGLFFGFIYVKTGNILYTILMHMIVNFLGSFVSMQLLENSGYYDLLNAGTDPNAMMTVIMGHLPQFILLFIYLLAIIGVVIAGFVLFIVKFKKFSFAPGEIVIPKGKRFSLTILNVGMILFIVFWTVRIIIQFLQ